MYIINININFYKIRDVYVDVEKDIDSGDLYFSEFLWL